MTHLEKTIVNLRNVLRSEGIKGMDSINHCIAFILMKYIDAQTCETYNIPLQYTYDSILNHIKLNLFEWFCNYLNIFGMIFNSRPNDNNI